MNEYIFAVITAATILIPIVAAILQKTYLRKPLIVFLWYRVFALVFNFLEHSFIWFATKYTSIAMPYLKYWAIKDTSFLSILYILNDFVFLGWFYYLLLGKYSSGKWIRTISFILIAATLSNYLFIEGYNVVGVFNPTIDAIFIFSVAAFYLWHLYRTHLMLPLQKNPYFWISFGLIVPHVISFFLFLVGDLLHKEDYDLFVVITNLKNVFLIFAQVLFAIGFWQARYAQYLPLPGEEEGSASAENV